MSKKFYFCTNCRKEVQKVQSLLFVEESKRGFCSENCIVDFYSPYMEAFDRQELEYRHMLAIEGTEMDYESFQNYELFDQVLYEPDEIWYEKNEIHEEYYTHILNFGDKKQFYYIVITSYFEGEPSFVFFKCITENAKLVDMYRVSTRMDDKLAQETSMKSQASVDVELEAQKEQEEEQLTDINLPAELVEDLELKKSEYLANLIEHHQDDDIPIEKYPEYDQFIALTLEDPDEEYHHEDEAGDQTMTFIKSFKMNSTSFFYIVSCIKVDIEQVQEKVMIPIISFPSVDKELYKHYAVGDKVNGKIKS